ncbi:hypothetical protein [Plastoroseomonas arctica]|uniref:hypothetical protein n=1 Tax=Plastoroseomonas arctica TaxID=1509237 RepID=UPI001BADF816|nr:hypothetical protein [Plastoroseomonas arctica]
MRRLSTARKAQRTSAPTPDKVDRCAVIQPIAPLCCARHSIAALSCPLPQPRVYTLVFVEQDSEAIMDPSADFETVFFADYLVPVVLILALVMHWLLHQVTERMSRWHISLPGVITSLIWASAGWLIGGIGGAVTFALGTAASLAFAVMDERMRRARDLAHHRSGIRFS